VAGSACADDDGADLRPVQYPAGGDRADCRPVLPGDRRERLHQLLEQRPTAELVDDEPVFDQRAVDEFVSRIAGAEPTLGQEAAGKCSITQHLHAVPGAPAREGARRPVVEQGILDLCRNEVETCVDERLHRRLAPIADAEQPDLSLFLDVLQAGQNLVGAPARQVPPVELDQRQLLQAQPFQRPVDDRLDAGGRDRLQPVQVGHQLGVHLDRVGRLPAAVPAHALDEVADHLLHADIDVGAVEGGDASVEEAFHVGDRPCAVHGAVAARQLPAALYDRRELVARPKRCRPNHESRPFASRACPAPPEGRWFPHG